MKLIEGVPYNKYRVRFRTNDGKRRQRTVWSVGQPWLRAEVSRLLDELGDVSTSAPVHVVALR